MNKTLAGLVGAAAVLVAADSAQAMPVATPQDALHASSYAELLEPMPNALATLQALGAMRDDATAQLAQYGDRDRDYRDRDYRDRRPRILRFLERDRDDRRGRRRRHHHHHHHNRYDRDD